jgi:hypothetical protein
MEDGTRTDDLIALKKIEFVDEDSRHKAQNAARRNDVRQFNSCDPFEG